MTMQATSALNVSSVLLRHYPESSPWDVASDVHNIQPPAVNIHGPMVIDTEPQVREAIRKAALAHAQKTKFNPFHFRAYSNPYELDNPELARAKLPFDASFRADTWPLPRAPGWASPMLLDELSNPPKGYITYRVSTDEGTRMLKVFLGRNAQEQFDAESAAYSRLLDYQTAQTGAVLQCYGFDEVLLDRLPLKFDTRSSEAQGVWEQAIRDLVCSHKSLTAPGILLDNLPSDVKQVSIHTISLDVADRALRSLYHVHTAYVLHGNANRQSVFVDGKRAIWVNFGVHTQEATRQTLFSELAEVWDLMYRRLLLDSQLQWEAGPGAIDLQELRGPVVAEQILPLHKRPSSSTVQDEIVSIVLSYPEINPYSWDPPLLEMTPAVRYDHRYDTDEFLAALQDACPGLNPFWAWYGPCPYLIATFIPLCPDGIPPPLASYAPPKPLPQLSSETKFEFLEHINPSGNRVMMRVRMGDTECLLKIFSREGRPGDDDHRTPRERFEIERNAYAHLVHYGACASGAVPQCYGWLELGPAHVYDAIKLIRRTRSLGFKQGEEPAWVSPIFDDGSWATALVLEYVPNAVGLHYFTVTPHRGDLALRAISRVHGAYVLQDDLNVATNMLLIRDAKSGTERVMHIDFDHSRTPVNLEVGRADYLNQFATWWQAFYNTNIPQLRLQCPAPEHPHGDVEFDKDGKIRESL